MIAGSAATLAALCTLFLAPAVAAPPVDPAPPDTREDPSRQAPDAGGAGAGQATGTGGDAPSGAAGNAGPPGAAGPAPGSRARVQRNVSYAGVPGENAAVEAHPRRRLDLFLPEGDAPPDGFPVLVFIHGGGWRIGDKALVQRKPAFFNDAGWIFVSVNYRLTPEVMHPGHAQDVAAAVAFLHAALPSIGGDPTRMVLMGHSAGAHLAAIVATDPDLLGVHGLSPRMLAAVVLLDGAGYDLAARRRLMGASRWRGSVFEAAFGQDEALLRRASPVTHITRERGVPPMLAFYVPSRPDARLITNDLVDRLLACGHRAIAAPADDRDHGSINRRFGDPGDHVARRTLDFLRDVLAERGPARAVDPRRGPVGSWRFERVLDRAVPADARAAGVTIGADGSVAGSTGVNAFGGEADPAGFVDGMLRLGPIMSTRRAGPPQAMALERDILTVLAHVRAFRVDHGVLILLEGDSELARLIAR